MSKVALGAALEYTNKTLSGPTVEIDNTISVSTTATVIADGNGDRVGLIIVNLGGGDAFIAPDAAVSGNLGIRLSSAGGGVAMTVAEDFTLQTRRWYAVVPSGGPSNIFVIEYSRFALDPRAL